MSENMQTEPPYGTLLNCQRKGRPEYAACRGGKDNPQSIKTEKEQLEKKMPALRSERARACHDPAFAEVISYNKANLERVEQNEGRQQNSGQG